MHPESYTRYIALKTFSPHSETQCQLNPSPGNQLPTGPLPSISTGICRSESTLSIERGCLLTVYQPSAMDAGYEDARFGSRRTRGFFVCRGGREIRKSCFHSEFPSRQGQPSRGRKTHCLPYPPTESRQEPRMTSFGIVCRVCKLVSDERCASQTTYQWPESNCDARVLYQSWRLASMRKSKTGQRAQASTKCTAAMVSTDQTSHPPDSHPCRN